MSIPAFCTIAYKVAIGQSTAAEVMNALGQDVGASAGTGPIEYMQWPSAIHDAMQTSLDGLSVRRMITFPTPPVLSGGQLPYSTTEALLTCMRNLYTGDLEGFCGVSVSAFEPVLFDTPQVILGLSLDTWWHAGAAPVPASAPSVFTPASWPGDGPIGVGRTLLQANPALQFAAAVSDQFASRAVASSTGAAKLMDTGAAFAPLVQPYSAAIICAPTANGTFYDAVAPTIDRLARAAPLANFTTDGVNTFGTGAVPAAGASQMFGSDANGTSSHIRIGTAEGFGNAGIAGSNSLTLLNDNAGGTGMAGVVADMILGATTAMWTDAQWSALYDYARGWYGIDLW